MQKLYPILYSLDSKNKVRIWRMEQNEGKYRTISGIQNGQLVTSEWTIATPKNKGKENFTTEIEQAALEVDSKYRKQLKTGYFKDIKDINIDQYFQVMLAKNYNDYKDKIDWDNGVGVQIKYNGGRIIARKEGMFTRKGERILSVPHIEEALLPIFNKFPNLILDGEGFNYYLRNKLNEIMSLLRKTVNITPEDLQKSKELIRYYIYDGGGFDNVSFDDEYLCRKQAIDFYLKKIYGRGAIEEVQTWIVYSEKELQNLYEKFLDDEQEGAIIRISNKPYECKRSQYLLKYKPLMDDEGIILNIIEGDGNWAGAGKVIELKWKDKIFNATLKGSYEQAAELLKNKNKWIGKEVTFLYNDLTGLGTPNFARVDYNNCFKK